MRTLLTTLLLVPLLVWGVDLPRDHPDLNLSVVPGVGSLGQTFSLFNPLSSSSVSILDLSNFDQNLTTPDWEHRLPNGVLYSINNKCFLSPITRVANNVKDFQQRYAERYNVGGEGLWSLLDTFNDDVRWAYYQMENFGRSIQYSEVECLLFDLQVNKISLAQWFVDEIDNLPEELNGDTLSHYIRFFSRYGDHVYTKCSVGGLLNQFIATDKDYWMKKNIEEIQELSEKTFIVNVEPAKSKIYDIDPAFLNSSIVRPIKYFGGMYPEFVDSGNWNMWASSIMNRQNLICAKWEATPITELFDYDHRVLPKKENITRALDIFLSRPMCQHIEFSAGRPMNTIMKISDVFKCSSDYQGSWWLVEGPDRNTDECLVSWVFMRGNGAK